jgi:hypothetical protein
VVPFLICEFKKETLSNLVKECFGSDFPNIFHKRQIDYIFQYLRGFLLTELDAQPAEAFVLLEFEYIDKDYLDDYSKFYSRQFSNRGHKCARLHFFSKKIDHDLINRILSGNAETEIASLQKNYLGFMVVKPLPKNFIGKTCLRCPEGSSAPGKVKILARNYDVSLFGISLSVSSVGFQEQDKVVSACATTAIWAALHATSSMSIKAIPSHSQITTDAINFIPNSTNSFPSKELSNKQILRAFDVMGFRHHTENVEKLGADQIALIIKAYIDSGFPLVLIGEVGERRNGSIEMIAGHAVTVLGYKEDLSAKQQGMDALYIHDDRLGPYKAARFANVDPILRNEQPINPACVLLLREEDVDRKPTALEILVPSTLIVATPRNVRVPFLPVASLASAIDSMFIRAVTSGGGAIAAHGQRILSYCFKLRSINAIKQKVRSRFEWSVVNGQRFDIAAAKESDDERARQRSKFLTRSFARYQWVIGVSNDPDGELFEILLDATDTPQGNAVSAIIFRESGRGVLKSFQNFSRTANTSDMNSELPFLSYFLKLLKPPRRGLSEYLDSAYGELRAPLYIKKEEITGGDLVENASLRVFYEATGKSIAEFFPNIETKTHIWIINQEGALVIGMEEEGVGHPALIGSKPGRIAGEIRKNSGFFAIIPKSGRYSASIRITSEQLENAIFRFKSFFVDQFSPG